MTSDQPTLCACLTPPGRAAIATLGLRGPAAWSIARALFQRRLLASQKTPASLPELPRPGDFWLGWFGSKSEGADEVVLLVKEFTPVPWLELHCHGGPEVVWLLQEQVQARGACIVPWSEFDRAHLPPEQAAAQFVLAHAPTARTAAIALDQWHGAFKRAVERASQALASGDLETARSILMRLKALGGAGRHLVQPWRVVLAGAPNVGKSSLANALAGYARSVVAPTPGTTRDVVTTAIALDGWPIELGDTAGLRPGSDAVERAGIERARDAVAVADLCLWVLDGAALPVPPESTPTPLLVVINKTDLAPAWDWKRAPDALQVSAKTGAGVAALGDRIARTIAPAPLGPGEAVPFTEEMCAALDGCSESWGSSELRACICALEESNPQP